MARQGPNEGSIYQRGSDRRWVRHVQLGSEGVRRRRAAVDGFLLPSDRLGSGASQPIVATDFWYEWRKLKKGGGHE